MASIIIMRGISGSGKSTYIAKLRQNIKFPYVVTVVSMDHYFMQGEDYVFDVTKLGQAAAFCYKQYLIALASAGPNDLIIVDNTNTTAVEIAPYVLAAAAFDTPWCFVTLPVQEDLLRNTHGVPVESVQAQIQRFNQPLPSFWAEDLEFKWWVQDQFAG